MDVFHKWLNSWLDFNNMRGRSAGWHPYDARRPVRLCHGQAATGGLMRRWVKGAWEYRLCTPEELEDQEWWSAIR